MNKQTKVILAGAVVATGAYLYWKSKKAPKSFANVAGGGYYFGSAYIPAGAGTPFQSDGAWLYCPSGNQIPCSADLVRIFPNAQSID